MPARRSPWYLGYRGALAASLAVIGLIIVTVVFTDPVRSLDATRQFVTPVDQGHEFTAPDGSIFRLDPLTSVSLSFKGNTRSVELFEGALDVSVRPDRRRPFTVAVGPYEVRALGTRFRVEKQGRHVALSVREGRVRFAPRAGTDAEAVFTSGETAVELTGGQSLSWQSGSDHLMVEGAAEKDSGGE